LRKEIRIGGSGGQGVVLAGILLSYSIGLLEGLEVVQTQSYGPESRGGACKSELIIGNEKIDYVKVEIPDFLIAMNEHSFEKYYKDIKPNGLAIVDSSLVKVDQARGSNICSIPARWLAEDKLKSFVGNMVIIGAFAKITGFVSLRSMIEAAEHVIPINHKDINKEALRLGYGWVGV
jgi:2-oxoglutarate ferredoxin oxidoreductase subunit gamma